MSEEIIEDNTDVSGVEDPSIQMQDLDLVIKLIDVVTARGAFRGEELESVGALRTRFVKFLQANATPSDETVN